ncbi:HTH domain-containing protein [uncultured Clostridium sp.]|uniref:HTH domain-containing protein n=1 Tax=uncultured Clostridium sp. TaxID=59620 RepID=UPI0025FB9F12|nr:HTH domain-containing protein [uncultured Clostridium sp.]
MEIRDKVLEVLKNSAEPMKGGEIAEATGIDKKEIDKAIKALKAEGTIISPKRCYYVIAE